LSVFSRSVPVACRGDNESLLHNRALAFPMLPLSFSTFLSLFPSCDVPLLAPPCLSSALFSFATLSCPALASLSFISLCLYSSLRALPCSLWKPLVLCSLFGFRFRMRFPMHTRLTLFSNIHCAVSRSERQAEGT
jgi:hypothetical protein